MAAAAWTTGAGLAAGVGVNAELQSLGVNIISKSLNAGREVLRIGDDVAVLVARDLPAIVDDDVLVAGIFHAGFDHGIGHAADHLFIYIAAEFIPTVPAHWRGERETFIDGGNFLGDSSGRNEREQKCEE